MIHPLYPKGSDPLLVGLAGDWHGNAGEGCAAILRLVSYGADIIVHLGDFGFWRDDMTTRDFLMDVERVLAESDLNLVWVDGNHEDHARLNELPVDDPTGLRRISDHVWHLPRGYRWAWHSKTWMALGGAHSVDRQRRTPGLSWWPEETLTDAEVDYAERPGPVDVLVCHDAPTTDLIPGMNESNWPAEEIRASVVHQARIRDVVETVKPSVLYHGHFHTRYEADFIYESGQTHVVGLAHGGARTIDENVVLIDAVTLWPVV